MMIKHVYYIMRLRIDGPIIRIPALIPYQILLASLIELLRFDSNFLGK